MLTYVAYSMFLMKKLPLVRAFVALWAVFFISAAFSEPQNLALLTREVKVYHDSGHYLKDVQRIIEQAQHFILSRVQSNKKQPIAQKLAIVLDIDETSLTNYHYMARRNFIAQKEQLHQEILAADAPAIKPTLKLYRTAIRHGIHVFFITGRRESEREATAKNLKRAGFSTWSGLFLKPEQYDKPSIIPFKAQIREHLSRNGYTIIASIGDQCSDIRGGFVEKGFKLPNPYYHLP